MAGLALSERARTDEFSPRLYYRDADFKVVDAVGEVAKARGLSNMQVALAWVLKNPAITSPIIGASKLGHLEEAVSALDVKLGDDEVKALEKSYQAKPVLAPEELFDNYVSLESNPVLQLRRACEKIISQIGRRPRASCRRWPRGLRGARRAWRA